jgi:hypothetical protein
MQVYFFIKMLSGFLDGKKEVQMIRREETSAVEFKESTALPD